MTASSRFTHLSALLPLLHVVLRSLVLATLSSASPALAQTEETSTSSSGSDPALGFTFETSVRWVLVPVVVEGPKGLASHLERSDFNLWVDDRRVTIESFESGHSGPFSLVVLQDVSGSMDTAGRLGLSRRAVHCIVDDARGDDEVGLASFASDRTRVDVPLTNDQDALHEAITLWEARGTTALHDAVAWLPELNRSAKHPKSGALLLTDGVDNASVLDPETARNIVARAEFPVYILAFQGKQRTREPGQRLAYSSMLRTLAYATTGQYLRVTDAASVDAACQAILRDLRHQYVLGFRTRSEGSDRTRDIRVEVDSKKLRVTHRRQYLGTLPAN